MNTVQNLTKWLLAAAIPLLLLSAALAWQINSLGLYTGGFEKYDVSQTTGISDSELAGAAQGLIDYFNSDEEFISLTVIKDGQPFALFNEKEIQHLADVKQLFQLDYRILIISLLYLIGFTLTWWLAWRRRHPLLLAQAGGWGALVTLGIMALVRIISNYNFNWFFTTFHQISFANDLWLLNPDTDYLIMMFPEGFWYDTVARLALIVGIVAIVIGGSCLWYIRHRGKPPVESPQLTEA